jgi:type II secretory pathway pseudopilin PulG
VAALTMPALVANYQKKQTVTQLQKTFSVLNQAFALSQTETDCPALNTGSSANNNQWFGTYFFPYLKTLKVCIPSSSDCWAAERASLSGGGLTNMTRDMASAVLTDGTAMILRALNSSGDRNYVVMYG